MHVHVCMYVCMYSERAKVLRDRVNMNEQEARIGSLLNTLVWIRHTPWCGELFLCVICVHRIRLKIWIWSKAIKICIASHSITVNKTSSIYAVYVCMYLCTYTLVHTFNLRTYVCIVCMQRTTGIVSCGSIYPQWMIRRSSGNAPSQTSSGEKTSWWDYAPHWAQLISSARINI